MSVVPDDTEVGGDESVGPGGLLERDHELAMLRTFIDDVGGSGMRLMLIEGPAGIGKSTLLAEARAARRRGRHPDARSGAVRCSSASSRSASSARCSSPSSPTRSRARSGCSPAPRRRRRACSTSVPGEAGGDTSFAALHGLYWLTVDLAGR